MAKVLRKADGGDLRKRILDVSSDLFAGEGYSSVSMRRIGAEVGCSAMAMYRHFASKEDLLISICEETFLHLAQSRDLGTKGQSTPLERLRAAMRAFIRFGVEHPNHYKLAFMTDFPPGPIAARKTAIVERSLAGFKELVRDCAALKDAKMDVELTVQVLRVACQGLVSAFVVQPSDLSVSEAVAEHLIHSLTSDFE